MSADPLKTFSDQCSWVWIIRSYYLWLYEEKEKTTQKIKGLGPVFFHDLADVLAAYIMLQMCRLTDPAKTKSQENLTIRYLLDYLPLSASAKGSLIKRVERLEEIVKPLRAARNKILAHADKDVTLNGTRMGMLKSHDEYEEFFDTLDEIVREMSMDTGKGWTSFQVAAPAGPLEDFVVNFRLEMAGRRDFRKR